MSTQVNYAKVVSDRIRQQAAASGRPAFVPFITAGFPTKAAMAGVLAELSQSAAVIEVGIPFSDPMADGLSIQHASRKALDNGVTLRWALDEITRARAANNGTLAPIVLMGYLNPFLAMGLETLAKECATAGVAALIIPDLPVEEAGAVQNALHACGVGLIQLVSPVTPAARATSLCQASDGFVYAVTIAGVTGAGVAVDDLGGYLSTLKSVASVPVCAGFGIRTKAQIDALTGKADGVIVGSALIDHLAAGKPVAALVRELGY